MCEIFAFIASLLAGIYDFVIEINLIRKLAYTLSIIPIYVFIQRIHNQTQQRSLKSISEEISKVNDFVIEFIVKYETIEVFEDFDEKTISELKILKSKINAHLNYITEYLIEFPYGGPVNFAWYFFRKRYLFDDARRKSSLLEIEYQDEITNETILSLEIDYMEEKKKKELTEDIRVLNLQSIDFIINKGILLQKHLEENTRKMF